MIRRQLFSAMPMADAYRLNSRLRLRIDDTGHDDKANIRGLNY